MRAWTLAAALTLFGCVAETDPDTLDQDRDGFLGADDCDDFDAAVNPEAEELCNSVDDNCDGQVDEGVAEVFYADGDGDGYGDAANTQEACTAPTGFVANDEDCDDTDVRYNPGAAEVDCTDPNDYNCDGSVGYADQDGDGAAACEDCDDAEPTANPDADERCGDGIDNDCDRQTDEADAIDAGIWHPDTDGDSFGHPVLQVRACDAPPGHLADNTDCNDLDPTVYPDAPQLCDGQDNACGTALPADEVDGDEDGYLACAECDDGNAAVYPGADEFCNEIDDDCDGTTDENSAVDARSWWRDGDGDSFGLSTTTVQACTAPGGYVATFTDCDDTDKDVNPGASERCNGKDDDCDRATDEDDAVDASTFYVDADGDTWGGAATIKRCSAPSGFVSRGGDCDDTDKTAYPSATEVCDGDDEDCDGTVDESGSVGERTFYRDADTDTYGDPDTTTDACSAPSGYVDNDEDCDDSDKSISPDGVDVCDGKDNDCSGVVDDDDSRLGSARVCPGVSCYDILDARGSASDGVYWIDPQGSSAYQIYCDMTTDGGGWTLIHKTNKSNTSDRTEFGHNVSALTSATVDTVAVLPKADISAMGDTFRVRATGSGPLMYYTDGAYYMTDVHSARYTIRGKLKWADPWATGSAQYNTNHGVCTGVTTTFSDEHFCAQRYCCGTPNAGIWFNGGSFSPAYYSGTAWVR